jgi:hypothetical protein
MKAYLKAKIEELETNSKIKDISGLYRGISDFKKGYHTRSNIVNNKKCDWVADSTTDHVVLIRQILEKNWE